MKNSLCLIILSLVISWHDLSLAAEKPIRVQEKKSGIVSTYHLEDYVASVLAAEMPRDFPLEALKAQAVLIRTLAVNPQQEHRAEGFDLCDTTHCQLFRPSKNISEKVQVAARETRNQILAYHDHPIVVLYHSSCGGHTSPNQRVFGGEPLSYLQGVDDGNFCAESPQSTWRSTMDLKELEQVLKFSSLHRMQILDAEPRGRIFSLAGEGKELKIFSAQEFLQQVGSQLGWEKIKSAVFTMQANGNSITFNGRGLGHGVGLCQWGARGMALRGKNYREILQHYFPGTRLDGARAGFSIHSLKPKDGVSKISRPCGPISPLKGLTTGRASNRIIHPFDEISQNPDYQNQLKEILQQAIAHNYGIGEPPPKNLPPPFEKPVGLFVTVKKDDKVLGCMGTVQPQRARLAEEIFFNLQKAFSQDPRHWPISQSQLKDVEIVLTAAADPARVDNIDVLNPARDSILLRYGTKEGVVLAGEARTLRYMLALAKAKAGIKAKEPFQVYRLTTHILSIPL